jgi:hypothetical protein
MTPAATSPESSPRKDMSVNVSRSLTGFAVGAAMAAIMATAGAGPAVAGPPVRPNQHFRGLVNGSRAQPVTVYTVCPGPAVPGGQGGVAGGQTMSLAHARARGGDTGVFDQVHAWFQPPAPASPAPPALTFTSYGVAQAIPTTWRVPCDGTGAAVFSSCPYLAPCAAGFVQDVVKVRFVNLAV